MQKEYCVDKVDKRSKKWPRRKKRKFLEKKKKNWTIDCSTTGSIILTIILEMFTS
jgi:predicted GIY-YIG superfamily endonuclease